MGLLGEKREVWQPMREDEGEDALATIILMNNSIGGTENGLNGKKLINVTVPAVGSVSLDFQPNMTVEQVRTVQGLKMAQVMDLEADPCEDFYRYACKFQWPCMI